jgi:hypothetical protein
MTAFMIASVSAFSSYAHVVLFETESPIMLMHSKTKFLIAYPFLSMYSEIHISENQFVK